MSLFKKETEGEFKFIRKGRDIYIKNYEEGTHKELADKTGGVDGINDAGFLFSEGGSAIVKDLSDSLNMGDNPKEREITQNIVKNIISGG